MRILSYAVPLIALLIFWLQLEPAVPPSPQPLKQEHTQHVEVTAAASEDSSQQSLKTASQKKSSAPQVRQKSPSAAASKDSHSADLTLHDDRMTNWLLETGQRVQTLKIKEVVRKAAKNRSLIIEGISEEGHSLKEHVDSDGRLIADEVIFSDGRKLSRLYYPDGQFKAVYFEQSPDRAYSGLFDEAGRTVEITELSANGKFTRKNPEFNSEESLD